MNRALIRISVACITGLAMLTTACSSETDPGDPTPAPTRDTATTTTASVDVDALTSVDPCELLSAGDVTSLGLPHPGKADKVGGAETCSWNISGGEGGLAVGVRPKQGFKDLDYEGEKTSQLKIGKYDATKIEAPLGGAYGCDVVISITESSSVQILGSVKASSTDTAAACDRATRAAELIAPKLP
jgi:hypothetical protein